MAQRKNVVLLFTKLPVAGQVKTRLTTPEGGALSPKAAATLYHCMLLDVVSAILLGIDDLKEATRDEEGLDCVGSQNARHDTYELVISTTPASHVTPMREMLAKAGLQSRNIKVIADDGKDFAAHYDHATKQCFDLGAQCVLSMRGDLPALTKADVKHGFEQLHALDGASNGGIVLAPNHRCGVSIAGWTSQTRFFHSEVFSNRTAHGVLSAYICVAAARDLPVLLLPPVPDIDSMDDLRHSVALVQALNYSAKFCDECKPWRTGVALYHMGIHNILV